MQSNMSKRYASFSFIKHLLKTKADTQINLTDRFVTAALSTEDLEKQRGKTGDLIWRKNTHNLLQQHLMHDSRHKMHLQHILMMNFSDVSLCLQRNWGCELLDIKTC